VAHAVEAQGRTWIRNLRRNSSGASVISLRARRGPARRDGAGGRSHRCCAVPLRPAVRRKPARLAADTGHGSAETWPGWSMIRGSSRTSRCSTSPAARTGPSRAPTFNPAARSPCPGASRNWQWSEERTADRRVLVALPDRAQLHGGYVVANGPELRKGRFSRRSTSFVPQRFGTAPALAPSWL